RHRLRLPLCTRCRARQDAAGPVRPGPAVEGAVHVDGALLHRPHCGPVPTLSVRVTRFDPTPDLIVVPARVWSPREDHRLTLAVDTGSTDTVIAPDVIDELGYSPRDGEQITTASSGSASCATSTTRSARSRAASWSIAPSPPARRSERAHRAVR